MKSRLEDLLATADRQLANRSYEAAIDNYRTALGEPGADEAGVQAKLDAACRMRDGARGIAPPTMDAPVSVALEPVVIAAAEPAVEVTIAPPPAPADETPIEPPSFQLIEDNPAFLEGPRRGNDYVESPPISILNPTLPPETPGDKIVDAIVSVIEFFS